MSEVLEATALLYSSEDKDATLAQIVTNLLFRKLSEETSKRSATRLTRQICTDMAIMYDLVRGFEWMRVAFTDDPGGARPQAFSHRGILYLLPERDFANGSCMEYGIADDHFKQYLGSRSDKDLDIMIGALCRPASEDLAEVRRTGDPREPLYGLHDARQRGELFHDLPAHIKALVFTAFSADRNFIHRAYDEWIFRKGEEDNTPDDDNEGVDDTAHDGPLFGWWSVFMDVAKSGVFGNLDQVHHTNFHTLCMHLVQERKVYLDHKAEMDRISSRNRIE